MRRRLFLFALLLMPLAAWLGYWSLGAQFSGMLAERMGTRLVGMGDGKFNDPVVFLHSRMREASALLTATVLLVAVVWGAISLGEKRLRGAWRWTVPSVVSFAGINLWVSFASGTCLFWLLLWGGKGHTHNLTQFSIKLLLMPEQKEPARVVLAGSSQMLAQVNVRQLNASLSPHAFATGLQFPGNRSLDFCLLCDRLERLQVDSIVCYVSELNFFASGTGPGVSAFFGFNDLPLYGKLGGWRTRHYAKDIAYGLMGHAMPVFRLRGPLSERVFGAQLTNLQQDRRDAALTTDLDQRAKEAAREYRDNDQATFQFAAFREFVARCERENRKVVICCGQLNPVLAARLDARFRAKMLEELNAIAGQFHNVVLVGPDALPSQTSSDYEDLTHVNKAAQERFTQALAHVLSAGSMTANVTAHGTP